MEVQSLDMRRSGDEVMIEARENKKKSRGVDIRIFLTSDDALKLLSMFSQNNQIFRLAVKAQLAKLDYEEARDVANVD
ncbi:hypothetical protein NKZ03_30765 [Sinorhizobium meliloti]|uniref:hypothetical protein n=1 Tax=Rhizobium meliloti TaxID=382 RepID=UPI003D648403